MNGPAHALAGALAGAAAARYGIGPDLRGMAAAALLGAGAGLLADLDHERSSVRRWLGPITATIGWVVCAVTRQRGAAHSLAVAAAAGYGTYWLARTWPPAAAVLIALLGALGAAALARPERGHRLTVTIALLAAGTAAGLLLAAAPGLTGAAVGAGWTAHTITDAMTEHGAPLLWPLTRRPVKLGTIDTGSWVERWLVIPALVAGLAALAVAR